MAPAPSSAWSRPATRLRWRLPLRPALLTRGGFLYGGAGLAAAVAALEAATGRPLVWATAQYLAYARMPARLDVTCTLSVHGNRTTQARATVSQDGAEILSVLATLGSKPGGVRGTWPVRPEVKPPAATRPQLPAGVAGTIHQTLDLRIVHGISRRQLIRGRTPPDDTGRSAFWLRLPGGPGLPDAADLAMLGDVVPTALANAAALPITGNSLDNTIRTAVLVPTEWVLADVRIHSIVDGFAHGTVHLWAEDGTLLGTASQSAVVRHPPP